MIINLSPIRMDDALEVYAIGDTLTINGEVFDFSQLNAGESIPAEAINSKWICGDVEKDASGVLSVLLLLPYSWGASNSIRYPQAINTDSETMFSLSDYLVGITNV